MSKKINLVYDGSMLLNQLTSGNRITRTGIFFVVYNVLKQFLTRPELNVSIYTPRDPQLMRKALNELYPEHSDIVLKNFNKKLNLRTSYFVDFYEDSIFENWNAPEEKGCWTREKSSFSFSLNSVEDVCVKMHSNAVLPKVKQVIVRNENNGRILAILTPEQVKDGIDVSLSVSEVAEDSSVCISIETVGASTPKVLGINSDERILGIRIDEIFIKIGNKPILWSKGYLRHLKKERNGIDKLKNKKDYRKLNFRIQLINFIVAVKEYFSKKYQGMEDIDIFFSPCFAIPREVASNKKIKKYTILYDTLPYVTPKEYYPSHGWKFLFDLYKTLNKKDYYFCISENTKRDFLKYVKHLDKKKMTVTLLAAADYFYKCNDKEARIKIFQKYGLPKINKYIFSLCTLDPRKNLVTPIRSFLKFVKKHNIKDLYFLLGGGHVNEYLAQIEDILKQYPKQRQQIIQLGYVDDEDLAPFLSNAEWDVYTPFYEGFGLPPLEAMQCGCPVIASDNSSLPEVVGDAGILIDCTSDEDHIKAYEKYYYDEKYRKEMAKKGYERAKLFSYEKMADTMVKEMLKNVKN